MSCSSSTRKWFPDNQTLLSVANVKDLKGGGQEEEQHPWSGHLWHLHVVLRHSGRTKCRKALPNWNQNKESSGEWDYLFSLEKRKNGLERLSLFGWNLEASEIGSPHLNATQVLQSSWENLVVFPRQGQACSGNSKSHQLFLCNPRIQFLA